MSSSLFDIVGPVMIGPSSSHTAGAVRLGLLARMVASNPIKQATCVLYNSFAKTYKGHGTGKGLIAGLMGFGVDDDRIRDIETHAKEQDFNVSLEVFDAHNPHPPNTVRFLLTLESGTELDILGHSIGAGKVRLSRINEYHLNITGEMPTLLMFYQDQPGMIWQVTKLLAEANVNIATLQCARKQRGNEAYMIITLDEMVPKPVIEAIRHIPDMYMSRCVESLPQ